MSDEKKVPGEEEETKVSGAEALKVDLYFWLQALVMALVGLILVLITNTTVKKINSENAMF